MKNFYIFIFLVFMFIPNGMNGQSKNRRNDNSDRLLPKPSTSPRVDDDDKLFPLNSVPSPNHSDTKTGKGGGITTIPKEEETLPDTILCWNIVKRNGWYVRLGNIKTKDEAAHTMLTWRLTNPDEHGIYRKVEAINAFGNYTTEHRLGTYISMQDDEEEMGGNTDWQQRIGESCIWRCETDDDGTVLLECAYDSQDHLIYSYTPIQVAPNRWVGTYTDRYGHPINLRADSTLTTMVSITRDKNGYEELAELLTADGAPAKNRNGVYQWRYEFDKDGYQQKQWSADIFGNPVIDNATNCGTAETKWDKKRGNWLILYSFNQYFKPLRLYKDNPTSEKMANTYIEVHDTYDDWGRLKYRDFYDGYGHKDSLLNGVSRQCYEYNDFGQIKRYYALNIKGKPICPYSNGYGYYQTWDYDSCGREVHWLLLDKDEKTPVNAPNYLVERETKFNRNGDILEMFEYVADENGEKRLSYCHIPDRQTGGQRKIWYDDGIQVKTMDKEGRQTGFYYFDKDSVPTLQEGYHSNITTYTMHGRTLIEEDCYYLDTIGTLVKIGKYAKCITRRDSIQCTEVYKMYNSDYTLDDCYMKAYSDSTLTQLQFQASLNSSEQMGIRGSRDRTYYYKASTFMTDNNKRMSGIFGYNEWNEPCYVSDSRKVFFYQRCNATRNPDKFYDENFNEITDMRSFVEDLPYAFVVEVIDSIGYKLGLKDGDVILRYGNCLINDSTMENRNEIDFYMENYLMASQNKPIYLMRHHPHESRSEFLRIDLPKGKMSDLGFVFHKIPYTSREVERYTKICAENRHQLYFAEKKKVKTVKEVVVFVPQKYDTSDNNLFYNQGMKDPMLLLRVHSGEYEWDLNQPLENYFGWNDEKKDTRFELLGNIEDGITTFKSSEVQLYSSDVKIYPAFINAKEYRMLQKKASVNPQPKVSEKQMIGTWYYAEQYKDYSIEAVLEYAKKGDVRFKINVSFRGFNIPVELNLNSWKLKGCIASYNVDEDGSIYGPVAANLSNEMNNQEIGLLQSRIERDKEILMKSTELMRMLNKGELYIKELRSGNIQISNSFSSKIFKRDNKLNDR